MTINSNEALDLNGGNPEPGNTLCYTISLNNSGDEATGTVSVKDDIPPFVENFRLLSIPSGAIDSSTAAGAGANDTGFLDVSGISVAAGGSEPITSFATRIRKRRA